MTQDVIPDRIECTEQCLYQCHSCKVSLDSAAHIRSNAEVVSALTAASAAAADTPWIESHQIVEVPAPSVPVSVHVARTRVHSSASLMVGLNLLVVATNFSGCVYKGQ